MDVRVHAVRYEKGRGVGVYPIQPLRWAAAPAANRLETPSRFMIAVMWRRTVVTLMPARRAIPASGRPSARILMAAREDLADARPSITRCWAAFTGTASPASAPLF